MMTIEQSPYLIDADEWSADRRDKWPTAMARCQRREFVTAISAPVINRKCSLRADVGKI
jgi:hypothetical protein